MRRRRLHLWADTNHIEACLKFSKNESGATAIEYGLIDGLIAVIIISALKSLDANVKNKFSAIANNLSQLVRTGPRACKFSSAPMTLKKAQTFAQT